MLEYQIQACKKPMPGKTWYVGTREVRSLHTLKDKVYMVSPETSIYKDLLISIAFPRFPLDPPFSSFFFFFFPVNLRNRLNIQQYHNIICPPPRCELHSSCSPLYSIWRFVEAQEAVAQTQAKIQAEIQEAKIQKAINLSPYHQRFAAPRLFSAIGIRL